MARVAVSIVGPSELPDDVLRRGAAALGSALDVRTVGPIVRADNRAVLVVIARSDMGLLWLARLLERFEERTLFEYRLLTYGALVYRSEALSVPPTDMKAIIPALESLHRIDAGFQIPLLGNVTAHLGGSSDRPQS